LQDIHNGFSAKWQPPEVSISGQNFDMLERNCGDANISFFSCNQHIAKYFHKKVSYRKQMRVILVKFLLYKLCYHLDGE